MPDRLALLVDLTGAQSHDGADHGVARVTQELAASLVRVPGLVRGLLLNPSLPIPGSLHPALLTSPLVTWNTASEVRRLAAGGPLAYLMPSPLELGPPSATLLPPHVVEGSLPILAVLHDLAPLRFPDRDIEGRDGALRYHARLRLYGEATRVLAVSRWTASDGVRLLGLEPDRVDVIGLGVAPEFRPPVPGEDAVASLAGVRPELAGVGVVSVAGPQERRNVPRLIRAWARVDARVRHGLQLGIVGGDDQDESMRAWHDEIVAAGLEGQVVLTGHLPDHSLAMLFRAARLHVSPSLHEGFGLAVAEGVACGCATLTASSGAAAEILDDPSTTFDPTDESSIATAIEGVLGDPSRRRRLEELALARAPLVRWDAVAQRVATVTAGVASAGTGVGAPPRRWRIAVVGAQPPSASPAAAPNRLLLTALAARAEVHAISDSPHLTRDDGITRLPPEALERHGLLAGFDALVFGLAGHADEAAAVRLARRHPGIVCLHDIRLGARPRDHELPGEGPALDIVRGARAVVVGSEPEARRLRLDMGPAAPPARLCVAAPDPGEQADQILRLVEGAAGAPSGTSR